MFQCGILPLLVDLSLSSNAPQRVKASALYALAELIRLSKVNQESLSKSVIIPAHPPPVIDEEASTGHTPPSRTSAQINRSSFQSGRGSTQVNLGPRAKCPAIVEVVAIAVGVYPGCTYSVRAAATCLFQVLPRVLVLDILHFELQFNPIMRCMLLSSVSYWRIQTPSLFWLRH